VNIRVFAEHVTPMLLMTLLRLGNLQKDLAVGTLGTASQVAVDARLRLFIGEITPPPPDLRITRLGDGVVPCRYVPGRRGRIFGCGANPLSLGGEKMLALSFMWFGRCHRYPG